MHRLACLIAVSVAALLFVSSADAKVTLVKLTSPVAAGGTAMLTVRVSPLRPRRRCSIVVTYKSGRSRASGLSSKWPTTNGRVAWTWTVGRSTSPGRWPIEVYCGQAGELEAVYLKVTGSRPQAPRTSPRAVAVGQSVALGRRTRSTGCKLGPNPDRRCSPGAYYSRLTKSVICSSTFFTSSIRNVSQSTKNQVKIAYGLPPRNFGSALEIDHIVPLELGGSNAVANLFPEQLNARPGYRAKDRLENRLHLLVCSGRMNLRASQRQIATNWQALYRRVFGRRPQRSG